MLGISEEKKEGGSQRLGAASGQKKRGEGGGAECAGATEEEAERRHFSSFWEGDGVFPWDPRKKFHRFDKGGKARDEGREKFLENDGVR